MSEQTPNATTAIVDAVVYCCDESFTCLNPGSVVFRDGIISAVGASGSVDVPEGARVIDGGGRLAVLPGLIDAHSHSSLLKGYSENAQLMDWLPEYQREHQVLTADDAYFGYLVSYMEALKGGTTTVMDMYRYPHRGAEAAGLLGMRAHLVPYAADHPTKHFFETLETSEQLIRDCHRTHDGRVRVWLGLEHITYCSEDMFHRVAAMADTYGVSIHTHTSEQREEVEVVTELFGDRPVHVFNQRGILRPGSVPGPLHLARRRRDRGAGRDRHRRGPLPGEQHEAGGRGRAPRPVLGRGGGCGPRHRRRHLQQLGEHVGVHEDRVIAAEGDPPRCHRGQRPRGPADGDHRRRPPSGNRPRGRLHRSRQAGRPDHRGPVAAPSASCRVGRGARSDPVEPRVRGPLQRRPRRVGACGRALRLRG